MKPVLDPASSSRMFYFDKADPRVVFGDIREVEKTKLCDNRMLEIKPDILMDFRNLPYEDNSFYVVVFDPPHLKNAGKNSWMRAKYGALDKNWPEDLKKGFSECFRVLRPNGILIFKWNEIQIPLSDILSLTNERPLIGHKSGKRANTHWVTFIKDAEV